MADTPLAKDDPAMIAWERYKTSADYANSFKWAAQEKHRDGSMWAAFLQGHISAEARLTAENERLREAARVDPKIDAVPALVGAYKNASKQFLSSEDLDIGHSGGVRDVAVRLGVYIDLCAALLEEAQP